MITASAPGKLVLMGEYAVLEGIPALSMAVNIRAKVTLAPAGGDNHVLRSSLAGGEQVQFKVKHGQIHRLDSKSQPGIENVLPSSLLHWFEQAPASEITLNTGDFYSGRRGAKLGLGSSAALLTALTGLERHLREQQPSLEEALRNHYGNQGGGSGVDVATSYLGGLIRFQRLGNGISARPVPRPNEWYWCCIWTGQPASTPQMLEKLRKWIAREYKQWKSLLTEAENITDLGYKALISGDMTLWIKQIAAYGRWMAQLGQASNISIMTKIHRKLCTIAENNACSYKPSGAGGGDVGIAFAASETQIKQFVAQAEQSGGFVPALEIDAKGLVVTA